MHFCSYHTNLMFNLVYVSSSFITEQCPVGNKEIDSSGMKYSSCLVANIIAKIAAYITAWVLPELIPTLLPTFLLIILPTLLAIILPKLLPILLP